MRERLLEKLFKLFIMGICHGFNAFIFPFPCWLYCLLDFLYHCLKDALRALFISVFSCCICCETCEQVKLSWWQLPSVIAILTATVKLLFLFVTAPGLPGHYLWIKIGLPICRFSGLKTRLNAVGHVQGHCRHPNNRAKRARVMQAPGMHVAFRNPRSMQRIVGRCPRQGIAVTQTFQ